MAKRNAQREKAASWRPRQLTVTTFLVELDSRLMPNNSRRPYASFISDLSGVTEAAVQTGQQSASGNSTSAFRIRPTPLVSAPELAQCSMSER
jgi:hypothetical protein